MRDIIFISHANPEDNDFTRWLALQIVREGYKVWTDITDLLGGEDTWVDIEECIRKNTVKFLFVLSKSSNNKQNPLKELNVALLVARENNFKDFILPLRVDKIKYSQINIQIANLNVISFTENWAKGYNNLLKKLEKDEVPIKLKNGPVIVSKWWRENFERIKIISNEEEYLSNWFFISSMPKLIFCHEFKEYPIFDKFQKYPYFKHSKYLFSFANASDLGLSTIENSFFIDFYDFIEGRNKVSSRKQSKNIVSYILKEAWNIKMESQKLHKYQLSNNNACYYFNKEVLKNGKLYFNNNIGKNRYRKVFGNYKVSRYWHYGIESKPIISKPSYFIIKAHILFSDDCLNIWLNKDKLHKARRSCCKKWWNSKWRDLLLITMNWLSNSNLTIDLEVGKNTFVKVSRNATSFKSPISYIEPLKKLKSHYESLEEELD